MCHRSVSAPGINAVQTRCRHREVLHAGTSCPHSRRIYCGNAVIVVPASETSTMGYARVSLRQGDTAIGTACLQHCLFFELFVAPSVAESRGTNRKFTPVAGDQTPRQPMVANVGRLTQMEGSNWCKSSWNQNTTLGRPNVPTGVGSKSSRCIQRPPDPPG